MNNFFANFILSFFSIFLFQSSLFSAGYIYPVGALHDDLAHIFLLQKTDSDQLLLWRWNALTKEANLELSSFFTPIFVKILPTGDGFSFVQDGLPRIKLFSKRSARTIELSEPFYIVDSIEWIDDQNFYFSAANKEKNGPCGIYQSDKNGQSKCLIANERDNFFSPSKVDDKLFFIYQKAESSNLYSICSVDYSNASKEMNIENIENNIIASVESQSIGFLTMSTKKSGFFVAYPAHFDLSEPLISCNCYWIHQDLNEWSCEKIFDFHLPMFMLMQANGQAFNQLICPFIPRLVQENFICCVDHNKLSSAIILFNMKTKKLIKIGITRSLNDLFVAPLFVHDRVFVGSIFQEKVSQETKNKICRILENEDGVTCINLASFSLQQ